jgi:ADP-ribose pyrophosphatase YjhB (NUDIX family)
MNLQVGVKAFLRNKEGKYLLLKRSSEKYKDIKGEWDIVGGRINFGSVLIDNLKREVKEETQLLIKGEPKLIYAQDIIMNDERDTHVVRLTYITDIQGEIKLDFSENVEYMWLSVNEMLKMPNLDIYVQEIIEKGLIQ